MRRKGKPFQAAATRPAGERPLSGVAPSPAWINPIAVFLTGIKIPEDRAAQHSAPCHPAFKTRYGDQEAGGGRGPRQPGQVGNEAALTSFASGHCPVSAFLYVMNIRNIYYIYSGIVNVFTKRLASKGNARILDILYLASMSAQSIILFF